MIIFEFKRFILFSGRCCLSHVEGETVEDELRLLCFHLVKISSWTKAHFHIPLEAEFQRSGAVTHLVKGALRLRSCTHCIAPPPIPNAGTRPICEPGSAFINTKSVDPDYEFRFKPPLRRRLRLKARAVKQHAARGAMSSLLLPLPPPSSPPPI